MTTLPLNIWSRSEEEIGRLMSHFAHTPFTLDGISFGSVEAFYTWLLVDNETRRAEVAPLWGPRSKYAGPTTKPEFFEYHGRMVRTGSPEHTELIKCANRAKLEAHPEIARAFVATLPRPIVHILPGKEHDPHDVFCNIMREIRSEFAARFATESKNGMP
jgi:hypothetical protein